MRRMETPPKRGRPPEAGKPRASLIQIRATAEEAEQFKAVGVGAFRRWLKSAYARLMKEGKPPA